MNARTTFLCCCSFAILLFTCYTGVSGQTNDPAYAAKIKEYTTEPQYLNEMVDHLPLSETVPSPLQHFGEIIGAPGILHYSDEIYGYFQALEKASPRLKIRKIGQTEEGRDMIEVIITDEDTL